MSDPGSLAANAPAERDLADCFAAILGGLADSAASRAGRYWFLAPYVLLLCPYLRRLTRRFDRLLARWRAGRLAAPRCFAPRGAAAAAAVRPRGPAMPRGFGWVLRLVPSHAAGRRSQLQALLARPEMVELLAASPQAGRLLRPLCHMLGITPAEMPPALRPHRGPPATAAPIAPAAPPPEPLPEPLPEPRPDPPWHAHPVALPDAGFVVA